MVLGQAGYYPLDKTHIGEVAQYLEERYELWHYYCKPSCYFMTIFILASFSFGNEKSKQPLNNSIVPLSSEDSYIELQPVGAHELFTSSFIRGYQLLVSPSKGRGCTMHPHCSKYALTAFKKFNPLKAWMLTCDRLHRCGHDLKYYDPLLIDGKFRFADSGLLVSNYDSPKTKESQQSNGKPSDGTVNTYTTNNSSVINNNGKMQDGLLWQFANRLMSDYYFDEAIIEFRRLLYLFPSSPYMRDANEAIFFCQYRLQNYLRAIHWSECLLVSEDSLYFKERIGFETGACYYYLNNFGMMDEFYEKLGTPNIPEVQTKISMLSGLALAKQFRWADAAEKFSEVSISSRYHHNAVNCKQLCLEGENLRYKNPTKAGVLSIIPGLGYLYTGFRQTALSSFVVNSLFIWGTYKAYHNGNQGTGVILTILSVGWYSGNIYGSVASATKKNEHMRKELISKFNIGIYF